MTATPLRHELLPALLATIVLALAYVAMIVNSDREQRQKVIADTLADDARASLSQVEKFFARQEAVLMTVAESRCVRDRLAVLCGEYFPRLLTRFPEAVNFAAADREGMIFASSRLFDPQRPPTTRHLPFFKTLADGRSATIMDPHTGPLSGEPVVGIAIALRDQNGHFAGVVGVTIDFDRLKRLWREDSRESRHQLAVVDGSQRLIFASGPFAEQRDQPATALDPALNHEGADRVSIAGQDFVTHTRFLRGGEWKIVALTPTSSVLDQYLSGNPMLVALLLPLLFLGALGLLSRRREQQAVSLLVASEERLHSAQEVLESTVAERTCELSGSEQRLRLLLDSTVEAIIGIGLDGCCTFCNPAALRMLGWNSEQDLLGSELHSLTHYRKADGSPYPPDQCPTHQVLRTGVAVSADDELFFRADRTSFPVRYSAHPIIREGTVAGAVLIFLDISKHKLAEQQLREIQKAQAFLSRCGYLDPQENFFAQLARYLAQPPT
jgi:PAS domain S-box-containing protein